MLVRRLACFTAASALAATLSMPAGAAALFKYVAAEKSARVPALLVAPVAVEMDFAALAAAHPGATFDVDLPNAKQVTIRIDSLERHTNGDVSWLGKVLHPLRSDLAATGTTGAAGTYADIETAEGTWGLVPSSGGHEWLFDKTAAEARLPASTQVDDAVVPPYRGRQFETFAKATCPIVSGMPAGQATIDVLAVTTPDFESTHGGAAGAETRLNALFANMNAYNAASNIAIAYRRVGTISIAYPAAGAAGADDLAALNAITNGTGVFGNVAALRNFFGADMVAMFRGPQSGGNSISGIAWINGDGNGNMPSFASNYMYSVSGDWVFPGATLPAHELGHNLGNNHDRPNAGVGGGTTPYAFGHFVCGAGAQASCGAAGFNDTGTGFGTIMSYHRPTVAKFANPSLTCQSTRPGALVAACGVADAQDDVRATNCVRQSVAAMRNSWVGTCPNLSADADNDGIPDCIEAGSGRFNGPKDNDIFGNALLFGAQQYRDFLAREGLGTGLNYWTDQLNSGARNRAQVAEQFYNTADFQSNVSPIARLYFAYFLRIPDYGGLVYWSGQLRAGSSLAAVSGAFATSAEFIGMYGALSNVQFVQRLYENVLGRAPDAGGLTYWTAQLDTGAQTRGQVMVGFSESAEFRGNMSSEIAVSTLYMALLRRAPLTGGFNYWVAHLDSGHAVSSLIVELMNSSEYRGRFLP